MSKNVKQFFILREMSNLKACIELLKTSFNERKTYSVEIKEYRKNRSTAQNRTYWMWVNTMAPHTGYTPDELHEQLKVKLLGVEEKQVAGETLRQPVSTASLNTKEFTEFLEKVELTATTMDVMLPYPDDIKYAMSS